MRVQLVVKLLALGSLVSALALASTFPITFYGEQQPPSPSPGNQGPSNFVGVNCNPLSGSPPTCVLGGLEYEIFSATLTQNTATNWSISVKTNAPIGGSDGFSPFAFGDALFQYGSDSLGNPLYWGVSLGSYTAGLSTQGDLYEENLDVRGNANSSYPTVYLTASEAGFSGGRANEPVWINTSQMTDVGGTTSGGVGITCWNGTTYVAPGINQTNCQSQASGTAHLYTITDSFNAPVGFLSTGTFSIEVASYVCANGLIIGSSSPVPEPRWGFLLIPALLLLGRRLTRSRAIAQQ